MMNQKLVSLVLCAFTFLFLLLPNAFAGQGSPFNNIVFFGDSLSDNGNLYHSDYGYLPKSPPYYQGRFSNGDVWSEYAAKYFYNKKYMSSTNFAIGGETTIFHNPINGFLPYSLTASKDSYRMRTLFSDRSHTLFVIWIGANDYLSGSNNVDKLTTEVVANIKKTVEDLIYYGGKNFLIINLPDISRTPYAMQNHVEKVFKQLITAHNQKLKDAVAQISDGYKSVNIHLFDLNSLFVDLLDNTDVYNKKYNIHVTNTKQSCWTGGYTRRNQAGELEQLTGDALEEQIYNDLIEQKKKVNLRAVQDDQIVPKILDDRQKAHYIAISPELLETFTVQTQAQKGIKPCQDADSYLFWDHIHPTAVTHKILGDYLTNYIKENYREEA